MGAGRRAGPHGALEQVATRGRLSASGAGERPERPDSKWLLKTPYPTPIT